MSNQLITFLEKENSRVCHEWSQWDGTQAHGVEINDRQCKRIEAFRTLNKD